MSHDATTARPPAPSRRRGRLAALAAGGFAVAGAATALAAGGVLTAAPASAASVPTCSTAALSARLVAGDPGAGQRYADVVLTNASTRTCSVHGWGGLALLGAPGVGVPTDLRRAPGATARTVVLARGASAHSQLRWGAVAGSGEPVTGACEPTATTVVVTPPSQRSALLEPWSLGPVCGHGAITQLPYAPGA